MTDTKQEATPETVCEHCGYVKACHWPNGHCIGKQRTYWKPADPVVPKENE